MNKPTSPRRRFAQWLFFCVVVHWANATVFAQNVEHKTIDLEGWSVEVDVRLTEDNHEMGKQVLRVVSNQLFDIKMRLPKQRVVDLQSVKIRIDLDHQLESIQYHPSRRWLIRNGHDPELTRKVHLPRAGRFLKLYKSNIQPFVMLHELSHAYHDQFLGFEQNEIRAVYQQVISDGKYDRVLHANGRQHEHYAKTNHKEYFAEMTEAFFGTNDFYPFIRSELKEYDRATFQLLKSVWMSD